jgi:hypothetical protein
VAIVETVIAQHAAEAAFLWLLREAACEQPQYRLKDLGKLDDRVEAHLDGLRIAGEEGWPVCAEALAMEEPGELFAAAELSKNFTRDPRAPGRGRSLGPRLGAGTEGLCFIASRDP